MHNKSKGKIRDTYLERKWRPTEAAAGLAVKEKARGRGMQRKNEKARGRRLARGAKEHQRRQDEEKVEPCEEGGAPLAPLDVRY